MRTGKLRHRVTLQQLGARVDDGTGGGSIPYIDAYENVAASVEPLEGNELLRAEQFESTLTHRVRTRYYAGVRPHWRIQYGSRVFDIKHVIDPEERHRELEMMCQELVTW